MNRSLAMLSAVINKEVRQTIRDKRMMALLLFVPFVQLILFGHAVDLDVDQVPTVIVDQDRSVESRHHIQRLLADGTLRGVASTPDVETAERMMELGQAAVVLVIPSDFSADIARGRPATVQAILDGSDPNRANIAGAAIGAYFAGESQVLVRARIARVSSDNGVASRPPDVQIETRVLFNPSLNSAIYMVPGVAAILLMLITTIVTSMGLAREREVGTLEQILVTPVPAGLLILGKIIPFAVIGLIDFGVALLVGSTVFDMPLRGDMSFLLFATSLYLLTTLGIGLLISTHSGSQQQAFMGGFLFLLPAALLSGIMTPIHSMPSWMQPLTLLNPLRHYAEILRASLIRGAGLEDLLQPIGILALMGVLIFGYASIRFRSVTMK